MSFALEIDEAALCTRPDAWTWWVNFTTGGPPAPGERPYATWTVIAPGTRGDLVRVVTADAEDAVDIQFTLTELGAPASAVRKVTS